MQNDGAGEASECLRSLVVGLAVVDDEGEAELVRKGDLRVEQPTLLVRCREAANGVETGLAHSHDLRMPEELSELVESRRIRLACAVRVDAECRDDAVVRVGNRECSTCRTRFPCRS